jgi:probable rRNA maturation factor
MILFNTDEVSFSLKNKAQLKKWIQAVIASYNKKTGDIAFVFCTDAYLLTINKQHLNHDTLTDIITFDYTADHPKNAISGDIFISVERVQENAKKFASGLENELHRILIHGVLHLLGHTDKTKATKHKMTQAEDDCLALLKGC